MNARMPPPSRLYNLLSRFPIEPVPVARYLMRRRDLLWYRWGNKKQALCLTSVESIEHLPIKTDFTFPIGSPDIAYQRRYNSLLMLSRDNIVPRSHRRICITVAKDIHICTYRSSLIRNYVTADEDTCQVAVNCKS